MVHQLLAAVVIGSAGVVAAAATPFRIELVEEGSGWPVPLVRLRTTHQVGFVSDNAGVVAIDLPELFGREAWFDLEADGYQVPPDSFGARGFRTTIAAGGRHRVALRRTSIARRLGRLTGAGIYGESQKLGAEATWQESGVFGCDSVQTAVHRGRLHWVWGDTTLARHPLGIFQSIAATTAPSPLGRPEPPIRLVFDHVRAADGQLRGVTGFPGDGPIWLTGLVSLEDARGSPRLVATYARIRPPLEAVERGLCTWNDETATFERHTVVWQKTADAPREPPLPDGHAVRWREPDGREWVLCGDPLPTLRFPARFEAWADPSTWEVLEPQAAFAPSSGDTPVKPHRGSIAWNPFRDRWVTVFTESFGTPSAFGEIWYAEARSPLGPWGTAVKILSHGNYTFYNPCLRPELCPSDSKILLFEGTYSRQFADRPPATPRHDYNQVLYRLDLDDAALEPARR